MSARKKRADLLPPGSLTNVCLGVSVSESADLARLGLTEMHFRLTLAEVARCVLVSGGYLAYGGHLEPQGYTTFLVHELERYGRRDRALKICLAWSEHRKLALSALAAEKDNLGLLAELVYLDPSGSPVGVDTERGEEPPQDLDAETIRRSLTGLRRYMARTTQGRLLIGGRRTDFQGDMPGLLEEALCAVEARQPLYLAGGYGGITHDIAVALGVDDAKWVPNLNTGHTDARVLAAMEKLIHALRSSRGQSLENGLSREENQQLATCHRPSEIATLVSLALGRRLGRSSGAETNG